MRALLDTHAFLWWDLGDPQISALAGRMIESSENELLVSAASLWEIAIKVSSDKLVLPGPIDRYVTGRLASYRFKTLPVNGEHALRVASLPPIHRASLRPASWCSGTRRGLTHPDPTRRIGRDDAKPSGRPSADETEARQARPDQGLGPQTRADPPGARRRRPRRPRLDLRTGAVAASTGPDERADPDHPDPEHRRRERGEGLRGAARGIPIGPARRAAPARAGLGRRRTVGWLAPRLDGGRDGAPARAHRRHPAGRPRAAEGAAHPGHAAHDPRGPRRPLARVPGRDAAARGARLADRHRRHRQEDGLRSCSSSASASR